MSDNSLQAPSPEHLAGLLPQYGIEFFIAQGGMGAVYKARQLSLDRDVAIKVLLYEFGGDAEFRDSFTTEAKAMARLNHPNLLGVFDYGDVAGMPYIVMEYVHGGSLHEAAWNQAIEATQAVAIVKGICDGLAHAHEHHIVHRDIKPSNILLTLNAEPKVADFGLAHAVDSDNPGLVMGTPGYTAPEVFHDPRQAGQLADVYSVGVILHQLLTGIDPAGSAGPPTQVTGKLRLDAIWRKATHITPAQRYTSIAAMASDLEKWSATKQGAPIVVGATRYRPPKRLVQTKTSGGGGILVKLFIAAILVAVVVFTYQLLQEQRQEIKEATAEVNGTNIAGTADATSTPDIPQEPGLPPQTPEQIEASPEPDSDIAGIDKREQPVIPPLADSVPEPESTSDQDLPPGDPELRERAVALILEARMKRDKELAGNASTLLSLLGSSAQGAKKDEAASIERLRGDVVGSRVPLTDGVIGLPDELARNFELARTKELVIDKAYLSEITQIRNAYVSRLEKAAAETSDAQLTSRLLAQAERAKDLDAWIGLLVPEPKWVPRKSSGAFGFGGFVGNWDNRSYHKESRWIAHPDGRMEIVGEKWEVTWKILEDGSLQVDWGKKAPYTYTRNGDGWIGTNPHGGKATLTRGDW